MLRRVRLVFRSIPAECGCMSALFTGVSRMWRSVRLVFCMTRLSRFFRLVFWCVQALANCPLCFLVCPDCRGVSAWFSGVSRRSRFVLFVFCCVENVMVCPPCFLVCPECGGVSAWFSGVCSKCRVSTFLSGLSRLSRVFPLVSSKIAVVCSLKLFRIFLVHAVVC